MNNHFKLWVPALFFWDHNDRNPGGNGARCTVIRQVGHRVLIEATPEQLSSLRSDAAFYCDHDGPDPCPPALKVSAWRTIYTIDKSTGALGKQANAAYESAC